MNKKTLLFLVIAIVLVCTLAVTAFAADNTVYVADGGSGDGSSASSPLGTLSAAISELNGNGGTIVLCGDTTVSEKITVPEQTGNLTFTAENGAKMIIKNRFQFAKNTNDNDVTINVPFDIAGNYYCLMFGGYNNIVFAENFNVTLSGGDSAELYLFGGVHAGEAASNIDCIAELPYSIEVNGGTFARFKGGNYRGGISDYIGSLSELVTITINGGTFGVEGEYPTNSNNKTYDTFSISGMSILAGGAKLTITGGTFNSPVYAQGRIGAVTNAASEKSSTTASDKKYYAIDGDVSIIINGGTFKGGSLGAVYTQAAYTQLMRGNFNVEVNDGTFAEDTIFDATQVKAYQNSDKKASLTVSDGISISAKRFDLSTGANVQTVDCDAEPIRVAFIGDSITEGYAPTSAAVTRLTDAYPAQFLANAEAAGKEVIVSNYGVSASGVLPSTKRDYFEMLAWPMVSEETDADYVFIAIGTNDANGTCYANGSNGSLLLFEENYTKLVSTMGELPDTDKVFVTNAIYRADHARLSHYVSATIHPIQERVAKTLAKEDSDKYIFVDLYSLTLENAENGTLFSSDNLHPGVEGLKAMGKVCYNAAFDSDENVIPDNRYRTEIYISSSTGSTFGEGTEDDPISDISVAFDKIALGSEVTIHIIDTFECTEQYSFIIPLSASKITIVGDKDDSASTLVLKGTVDTDNPTGGIHALKTFTNTKFDNLTLDSCANTISIMAYFNNLEITNTVKTTGNWNLYAGFLVRAASTTSVFDTEETASSSNDCVTDTSPSPRTHGFQSLAARMKSTSVRERLQDLSKRYVQQCYTK